MPERGMRELQGTVRSLGRKAGIGDVDTDSLQSKLDNDIPRSRERYLELMDSLKDIEKQQAGLSELSSSKQGMESEIKRMSDDIGRLEEELKMAVSRKARISEQVNERMRGLEALILESTQKKVNIRI